jgi:hypothetical protein
VQKANFWNENGTSLRSVAELGTDNGKTEQQPTHLINHQPTPADLPSAFYTRQPTTADNVTPRDL